VKGSVWKPDVLEREEKVRVLFLERAHKQVLTVRKNMHLILSSCTGTLVTMAISTAPWMEDVLASETCSHSS